MLDFDDPKHPVLLGRINGCVDCLYQGDTETANTIKAEIEANLDRYSLHEKNGGTAIVTGDGLRDPIDSKHKSEEVTIIDPLKRPIWYYINTQNYGFEHVIELCIKFYKGKRHIKLYDDGF